MDNFFNRYINYVRSEKSSSAGYSQELDKFYQVILTNLLFVDRTYYQEATILHISTNIYKKLNGLTFLEPESITTTDVLSSIPNPLGVKFPKGLAWENTSKATHAIYLLEVKDALVHGTLKFFNISTKKELYSLISEKEFKGLALLVYADLLSNIKFLSLADKETVEYAQKMRDNSTEAEWEKMGLW